MPPQLRSREGQKEEEQQQATVRVTNVSTDATRDDMHELFRPFGPIARVSVPQDRATGEGRGFAFIDFYNHADAAKAIEAINGKGVNSLILNVNWARPSADGGGGGGGGGDRGGRGGGFGGDRDRGGGFGGDLEVTSQTGAKAGSMPAPQAQTQLSTKMENILHNPTLTARARLPWLPASRNGQRPRRAGTIDAATTTTTASS